MKLASEIFSFCNQCDDPRVLTLDAVRRFVPWHRAAGT